MFKLSEVSEFEGTLYSHQDPVSPSSSVCIAYATVTNQCHPFDTLNAVGPGKSGHDHVQLERSAVVV